MIGEQKKSQINKSHPDQTQLDLMKSSLSRGSNIKAVELIFWALALFMPLLLPSHAMMISEIAITALFALSLDLVLGYSGIVSLGHAAFFGSGVYSAALFAKYFLIDPTLGLLVCGVFAGLLGFICSFTVLRGSDLTRLMVTLGVALIMLELANQLDWLTGGSDGLQGVLMGPVLGKFDFDLQGRTAAWYSLGVALALFAIVRVLVNSPWGYTLRVIRDNRLRAMAIGVPVSKILISVYTFAALVAGIAGGLLAQTTGFASLDVFGFDRSADLMLMLVIGGVGWLYGGIAGAIIFKILQSELSSVTPQYWMFWIGLLLIILVSVGREKIKGWFTTEFMASLFSGLTNKSGGVK
jgi:branched-chain amino acid transport system permease protein